MFVNAFICVVSAPVKSILNWYNKSTIFNSLINQFNNVIDCSFVFFKSNSKEVTGSKFITNSKNSVKFLKARNIEAFFTNIVFDSILIESLDSISVNSLLEFPVMGKPVIMDKVWALL